MKRFFSLLRAIMSQDMNIFAFKAKKNSSMFKKVLIPSLLALLVMYSIGSIYYPIAEGLKEANLTYIILSISIAFPSILAVMEGVYKSQSVLFEAKDSELLFSLPVSKKHILLARVTKLYVFQFLYSLLFVLPGIFWYAFYEKPDAYFYIITAVTMVLFPIIPTIIGCFIGFLILRISIKFKSKKVVQTFITMALICLLMFASFKTQDIVKTLVENANNINEMLTKIYYPIGAYNTLINGFDIIVFLKLLLINIIPVALFVLIASRTYFKIISKTKGKISRSTEKANMSEYSFKAKGIIWSLTKKEFSKYFSSTVYMINTLFGLVLLVIATVSLCMNFDSAIASIATEGVTAEDIATLHTIAPKVFLVVVIGMAFMTSITSSSISLEGKAFNISKSLPVKTEKILFSKILMSNLITIPVIIVCDIIFFSTFDVTLVDIITIVMSSFIAPTIAATFGLIINLKYPKMDASSDSVVVKQSMSSMISVFGGIIMAGIFGVLTFIFAGLGDIAMIGEIALLAIILIVLWSILSSYGKKRYKEIEA